MPMATFDLSADAAGADDRTSFALPAKTAGHPWRRRHEPESERERTRFALLLDHAPEDDGQPARSRKTFAVSRRELVRS